MQIVRKRHKDGIHILDHLLVIGDNARVRAELLCHLLGALGDDVADRGDLDPLDLVDIAGVAIHHTAAADQSDSDVFH